MDLEDFFWETSLDTNLPVNHEHCGINILGYTASCPMAMSFSIIQLRIC